MCAPKTRMWNLHLDFGRVIGKAVRLAPLGFVTGRVECQEFTAFSSVYCRHSTPGKWKSTEALKRELGRLREKRKCPLMLKRKREGITIFLEISGWRTR